MSKIKVEYAGKDTKYGLPMWKITRDGKAVKARNLTKVEICEVGKQTAKLRKELGI